MEFDVRAIEPGDSTAGFSLGDARHAPLKIFLRRHAKSYHAQKLAFTYGVFEPGKRSVVAYVTLVCGEVVAEQEGFADGDAIDYRYRQYPAIKIARLAVDREFRIFKLGTKLVSLALGIAKGVISAHAGCRFLIVDAKQDAVPFYAKCGFTLLDTAENKSRAAPVMFIDLAKI